MTITSASRNNAEPIKVLPKRHKFFIYMDGEKRAVLTRGQAVDLYWEIDLLVNRYHDWLVDDFKASMAVPEGAEALQRDEPLYAVSIFEKEHNCEDLTMLQAWLKDGLFGWSDPLYRQVTFIKRIRRDAEQTFAGII